MSPRIDRPRTDNSRLDNLVSWFAASVPVTAGVIYGLKFQNDRRRQPQPEDLPPRATPAQEPLTLHQLRAAERGRGRSARAAAGSLAFRLAAGANHLLDHSMIATRTAKAATATTSSISGLISGNAPSSG
jgi:hypothetical protein